MTTINERTDSVSAVRHAVMGGKFRVRLTEDRGAGHRWGDVLDDAGERIGSADDYTYGGRGFAVHTVPFAGYVSVDQIEFVPTLPDPLRECFADNAPVPPDGWDHV